ncbi:MAG: F0F1 ATP synthase subunit epsilon [Methylococcales bacterium]|jgi:F-type H+-transporting ATPase subunit epsilon|nr:F0F1 ATP synthase subunit epsilon [Methylococcales bacterium]MBT7411296.1 F0F1 ATP synthase subunit epsilon [Methylococcales bacterium]
MGMTIHIDIVSAELSIYSGLVEMVFAPAEMGEVGIAPQHTPLLTRLKPGNVRLQLGNGKEKNIYVSGGILEVQPHIVTVLANTAIRADELDHAEAEKAKKAAEETLAKLDKGDDYDNAQIQLAEAIAQLKIMDSIKKEMR